MNLRPDTTERIRDLRENGMSVSAIAQKLGLSQTTVRHVLQGDLTPLNVRTNILNAACKARGGCVPGEEHVNRSFPMGDYSLPVCSRCLVPIVKRGKAAFSLRDNSTLFRRVA